MKKSKENSTLESSDSGEVIALRDFTITQNDEQYIIKKGDCIKQLCIPEKYFQNLKTEQVIL